MRYATIAMLLALLFTPLALADETAKRLESSPRHHEWVDLKTADGRTVKCWVVYPEVSEKATAVLVIHENRGLNDWARSAADQVAEAGYIAIAPDMLSGTGPDGGGTSSFASEDAARTGIYQLKQDNVTANLDAAYKYAKQLDAANGKVAVSGFCWGGGQSFAYATKNPELAAAFVFYGTAPKDEAALESIKCPVYGFYGGNDFRITGQVPDVAEKMKELGKKYEPAIYEDAGHGFMRAGEAEDASKANRAGHDQAWQRWKKLLSGL
ncbi:dienelactone hydrolase family protein [Aeoliella sp. ICT_H6.2]|uniref:Dienelactone hydrolase family protein n=1 Tax=Aeoliella straminimaris TaxID=2954799 RepID=A0A9X2JJ00_9BACT|nr:dienelactone hydrolase family protein [Aeoliella straminimaris]MCO6047635.1 dienelactone hydrolase family protein [Aeoliella straminimaris]